jgi:Flp pilus assembly protein TadG
VSQDHRSLIRRALGDESGQVLPLVALMMLGLAGAAGLVVDVGQLFLSQNELQASTDAASLAGAHSLPNTAATTIATTYSAASGGLNAQSNLPNVVMVSGYPMLKCLSTLTNQSIPCVAPANANAIQVKQQVSVRTYFAGLLGFPSVTLTATSTAAMRGGATPPYNVAIIVDTTASMNSTDSSSTCNSTRLKCALAGIQTLLKELSPCGSSQSICGAATNGNVVNSVDRVSLFAFPNVTQSTVANDYNCSGTNPTSKPYTFPVAGASSYAPASSTPTYQIVPYSSDYRLSDTATSLNSSSLLTIAVGGKAGCTGMGAPGGQGTYDVGAIYAAQASLVAIQAANPGSQNVIILLSDGDASASSTALAGASTTSGTYASTKQQCHQAITAAQAATAAGTRVYTIAYGAAASGCSTDTTPAITPCKSMQQMASSPLTFFSDYAASGGSSSCISASRPTTNLNQIFTQVAGDFTTPRLIPNNTM